MLYIIIGIGTAVCALQAIRSPRLLVSALWLAGTSALVALLIYLLGAPEVAVIELSVGAGLVTVLFVFAINIAGESPLPPKTLLPKPLAILTVAITVIALAWLSLPSLDLPLLAVEASPFQTVLWEDRSLDLLLQIALIFAGVMGVLGLLADDKSRPEKEQER